MKFIILVIAAVLVSCTSPVQPVNQDNDNGAPSIHFFEGSFSDWQVDSSSRNMDYPDRFLVVPGVSDTSIIQLMIGLDGYYEPGSYRVGIDTIVVSDAIAYAYIDTGFVLPGEHNKVSRCYKLKALF